MVAELLVLYIRENIPTWCEHDFIVLFTKYSNWLCVKMRYLVIVHQPFIVFSRTRVGARPNYFRVIYHQVYAVNHSILTIYFN